MSLALRALLLLKSEIFRCCLAFLPMYLILIATQSRYLSSFSSINRISRINTPGLLSVQKYLILGANSSRKGLVASIYLPYLTLYLHST